MRLKVMIVIGTRPEAIKMAPVVRELARHPADIAPFVCASEQHRDLLAPAMSLMGLRPDRRLDVMADHQTLAGLTARLFHRLDPVVTEVQPDWVLVQGDTSTAMVAATVAFYRGARVGHVEAGLRTADLSQPFPEEFNRRVVDLCADLCFAPTMHAHDNLVREGVAAARVHVTGNTIVDAVREIAARPYDVGVGPLSGIPRAPQWVLLTTHRRESFGAPLEQICAAIRRLAETFGSAIHVIVPVHPNPHVGPTLSRMLALPNISLLPPLDYPDLIHVLGRAALVLTDSGGIQEEAPTFGTPILVLREKTERPEGVEAGVAQLVGHDADVIVAEASRLLRRTRPAPTANPYGDGHAARRIVAILRQTAGLAAPEPDVRVEPVGWMS